MSLCWWIREHFREIDMDLGTAVHFLYGLLGILLGWGVGLLAFSWAITTFVFIVKQLLDVYGGEKPKITGGDIAEKEAGTIVGLVIVSLLGS